MAHAIKITQLPYMGIPKEIVQKNPHDSRGIDFSQLRDHETATINSRIAEYDDPYIVLTNKITHLAKLLDCTEERAERLFFDRLGS